MKNKKIIFLPLFFISVVGVYALGQTVVNLGTADTFAILAGSTITNTGSTVVNGDIGLTPGTAVTGFPPGTVNGMQHVADTQAVLAQTALVTAYNDASGRTPVSSIPTELGGTTKMPGVYDSPAGTFGITGTLTLDAAGDPNAVFIFKSASTLTTAGGSNIILIGGAQACNVFWQVGSSATLGINSNFKGNILALSSVTVTTGANVTGRILTRNGAVTLDSNMITKAVCAAASTPTPAPTPVTTTSTPVVIVVASSTIVSIPTPTLVVTPKLPNTGIGPNSSAIAWDAIIPLSMLTLLFALYATRKDQRI